MTTADMYSPPTRTTPVTRFVIDERAAGGKSYIVTCGEIGRPVFAWRTEYGSFSEEDVKTRLAMAKGLP